MKRLALWAAILIVGASVAIAQDAAQTQPQTTCPVMGGPFNKEIFVDHNGQRVYFCCNACVKAFKADPDKYLKIMKDEGVVPEKTPVE